MGAATRGGDVVKAAAFYALVLGGWLAVVVITVRMFHRAAENSFERRARRLMADDLDDAQLAAHLDRWSR